MRKKVESSLLFGHLNWPLLLNAAEKWFYESLDYLGRKKAFDVKSTSV